MTESTNVRRRLIELIRDESGMHKFGENENDSSRTFITNDDIWKIYLSLCLMDDKAPEYVLEGRKLVEKGEIKA